MFHTQLALLVPAELVSATVGNSYVVNLAKMGIKEVANLVATPPLPPPSIPAQRGLAAASKGLQYNQDSPVRSFLLSKVEHMMLRLCSRLC